MASTPAEPNKRKDEDVELLKLVTAVLESTESIRTGTTGRRGLSILQRLRRAKRAAQRGVRRHPLLSISVLVAFIAGAYLLGLNAASPARWGAKKVAATASAGTAHNTSNTGSPAALNANTGRGRLRDPRLGQRDIAKDLITRVVEGGYELRSDVATGRFLKDFENQWLLLVDVHRPQMLPARRGTSFVQLKAPYRISESRWNHRTHLSTFRTWKVATEAMIRLVKEKDKEIEEDSRKNEEGIWKIEHIRVY